MASHRYLQREESSKLWNRKSSKSTHNTSNSKVSILTSIKALADLQLLDDMTQFSTDGTINKPKKVRFIAFIHFSTFYFQIPKVQQQRMRKFKNIFLKYHTK